MSWPLRASGSNKSGLGEKIESSDGIRMMMVRVKVRVREGETEMDGWICGCLQ